MDDFDLRDLLAPPLRMQSDLRPAALHSDDRICPEPMVLGMAYVPNQNWQDLYEAEAGFPRGTIFKQLDLPFEGGASR